MICSLQGLTIARDILSACQFIMLLAGMSGGHADVVPSVGCTDSP